MNPVLISIQMFQPITSSIHVKKAEELLSCTYRLSYSNCYFEDSSCLNIHDLKINCQHYIKISMQKSYFIRSLYIFIISLGILQGDSYYLARYLVVNLAIMLGTTSNIIFPSRLPKKVDSLGFHRLNRFRDCCQSKL